MKLMQKLKQLRCSRGGYAMLLVLSALLLFVVLGSNVLLAAQASAGTTARKQQDTQAYVLAVSALRCVGDMMEQGDFSDYIFDEVLVFDGPVVDAAGNASYGAPVTAKLDLPDMPNWPADEEAPSIQVDFTVDGKQEITLEAGGKAYVAGMLTARVVVTFRSASYSFLADFRHIPNQSDMSQSRFLLKGYRNNRGAL